MSRSESTIGTTVTTTTGMIAKTTPTAAIWWFGTGLIGIITDRTTECGGTTGTGATVIQIATKEDVQAALGISIGAGQPVSPAICTFDGAAGGVEVHVIGGDSAQAFSTLAQTPGAQKVPGLGDDAYQQPRLRRHRDSARIARRPS